MHATVGDWATAGGLWRMRLS